MTHSKQANKRLVFVGAGHAHLYSLARLDSFIRRGIAVTVISPAPFWYSGMGPGLLSEQYDIADATVDIQTMVESRGGRFIEDRAASINANQRYVVTSGGERLPYEALSLNIGSEVTTAHEKTGSNRLFTVKPVSGFMELQKHILDIGAVRTIRVLIVGGGPAGCETAANIRALCLRHGVKAAIRLLTQGQRLLSDLPSAAAKRMTAWCRKHDIAVQTAIHVSGFSDGAVEFADGSRAEADITVLATGVHPPSILKRTDLGTDAQGALRVDHHLQSISHSGIFGGGDCSHFEPRPLARVGVYAVRQAPVLFDNLLVSLLGGRMHTFNPQKQFMLILNLGDETGLLVRGTFVASGRMAFRLKKWLDRRFMSQFRNHGENM